MNEILAKNELEHLSSYKSNNKICTWLKKNRIPYILSGEGRPLVNRKALAYVMGAPGDRPTKTIELDFANQKGFK
jgi:hypothetical protein